MAEQVETRVKEGVARITLNRPPSNALTPSLRRALAHHLDYAIHNDGVVGIVLCGAGRGFCPGIDLSEYNGPLKDPWVGELCSKIENSPKPVVAALHGVTMGAGLELALAAHARVAQVDTRIAMPDVKLGLLPGAGATQRLPRLLGAQRALELLLSGQVIRASDTRLSRLFTQVTETGPLEPACDLAVSLAKRGDWSRTCDADAGLSDPEGYQAALHTIEAHMSQDEGVAADILRCVESAQLLPFSQGLALEHALFHDRLDAPAARAARHFIMAERFAAQPPPMPTGTPINIQQVALLGTDDKLGDISRLLLAHGFGVALATPDQAQRDTFGGWIIRDIQTAAKQGHITQAQAEHRISLLETRTGIDALARADLIIEDGTVRALSLPERKPDAIWATLERSLTAKARADSLGHPVIGLHVYMPLDTRQVVELSTVANPTPKSVVAVMQAIARLQKTALVTSQPAGAVGERLGNALFACGIAIVQHGGNPYDIDNAAHAIGFAEGPFELIDKTGLAVVQDRLARYSTALGLPDTETPVLERFLKDGRTGRRAGQGFYSYANDRPEEDDGITRLLPPPRRNMAGAGLTRAQIGAALQGALVNEASRLIEDHAVWRASDVDLVLVKGFGFDRALGGPLLQVDMAGLFYLYKEMQALAPLSGLFTPVPAVEDMVKNGQGFFGRSVG